MIAVFVHPTTKVVYLHTRCLIGKRPNVSICKSHGCKWLTSFHFFSCTDVGLSWLDKMRYVVSHIQVNKLLCLHTKCFQIYVILDEVLNYFLQLCFILDGVTKQLIVVMLNPLKVLWIWNLHVVVNVLLEFFSCDDCTCLLHAPFIN